MALGEYRPPNQINSDEDKYGYGRIAFTKIQIVYAICGLGIGFCIFFLLNLTGLMLFRILGIIAIVIGIITGVAMGGLNLPASKYLSGGGLRVDLYIRRKLEKKYKKSKKVVYTKNIDRDKLTVYRSKRNYSEDGNSNILMDIKSMFGGE